MASDRIKRHVERILDELDDAMGRLDWQQVGERAQAVLALDPGNGDATAFLAAADRALAGSASQPVASTPATSALPPSQPTSFANGRYQVQRFLGEGGKKKVYLAQDTLLDREVARLYLDMGLRVGLHVETLPATSMGARGYHSAAD